MANSPKFIFITGGVMSGLGKGIVTSSIAKLLQLCNLKVSCVKMDPYLNFDAGTMNPLTHGEVFVTDDGGECDMDIGNYERFLNTSLKSSHNLTAGRIFSNVMRLEREGKYLGQCVQIIPHITDEIKKQLRKIATEESVDVLVVECGGTVGDIESLPFLESLRQMKLEDGISNTFFVHVTLAPVLDAVGEQKTKPTQHSVQELRRIGIQPDLLAVRCKTPLTRETIRKISLFASVPTDCVISSHDVPSIYSVPEVLYKQGITEVILRSLNLRARTNIAKWNKIARTFVDTNGILKIAIVGKYVDLKDSYVSVYQALLHAGAKFGKEILIDWIDSMHFENSPEDGEIGNDAEKTRLHNKLSQFAGILVPGGFGSRGSQGIINTCNYARVNNIPFLGICFGFQLAIVEFARNVCGLDSANSTEINPDTDNPVVIYMPEQKNIKEMGGTMRLGLHEINVKSGSIANEIYKKKTIQKRHRHRYEFNQKYTELVEEKGLKFSGSSDEGKRMEILEIPSHPFYFGIQYHGEFHSRPGIPEPAFERFVKTSIQNV
ncbi:glutamine hydrolyzing CTP synthase [Candidatus Nitrosocosmicus franklandus]|uniref:CTP synthase n=1 Tax=Candidatus Nitrosocosmicus franklandianus TaxID=1798806 RepID=A0A484I6D6_9ARCH|nr:CTP synthase (glutamine hydrolyzing) [Candidatus Nitrosocosmicus franklandus]VFJ12337.1 CTP synthase [Candidatus Nitrosocosmicus franklandus]